MLTRHRTCDQHGRRRLIDRAATAVGAFVGKDDGQDVIEYGLLSAFFGIVCVAVWVSIQGHLQASYTGYDSGIQSLWESPNPGGS